MSEPTQAISDKASFPTIPASARMAVIIPTARWNPMAKSVLGSMLGVANEEIVVLIGDNSENSEKREFLKTIHELNPNILTVSHPKNIGGKGNLLYLFDWSSAIEFVAQMADDDWMSPTYHVDAYQLLRDHPELSCAEAGTTFVDAGNGKLVNVSQPSMTGQTPLDRLQNWNCIVARATMYNASRRSALEAARQFIHDTPLPGMTMAEDLWELNRLAVGDFLATTGQGCLIHYPENGSSQGDSTSRFYNLLCKDAGLAYPAVFFMGLSTAVQCALFLLGNRSPITDENQRNDCGNYVFSHIFTKSFLPRVTAESSQTAAAGLFANYPEVLRGFFKYSAPPFAQYPVLDQEFLEWFINVLKVFESKPMEDERHLSERFRQFVDSIMTF